MRKNNKKLVPEGCMMLRRYLPLNHELSSLPPLNRNTIMKHIIIFLLAAVAAHPLSAQEKTAEELVSSKRKADMSYRQLMEIMGTASGMIAEGIARENKEMVKAAADLILDHPAPNHKPWEIVAPEERAEFKKALPAYDRILDRGAGQIRQAAENSEWIKANKAAAELMNSCITCHAAWKAKAGWKPESR
ncbi:hypothetical protein CR163_010710 [Prosthecochloris sp. ZM_2]|nr:hypothetical protein CR163_010710 [Prosthecochloris sp. ZM_2]